jgi:hypothetical protein
LLLPDKTPHCFNKLADRNWFGQICLAAALADAFLVSPFMAKAVTANHRDRAQFGIVLIQRVTSSPDTCGAGCPSDDQIGPQLADKIKSLEPIAGAGGLIAMSFQQVAKRASC